MINETIGTIKSVIEVMPNGFHSWQETHAAICINLGGILAKLDNTDQFPPALAEAHSSGGQMGVISMAKDMADKFESVHNLSSISPEDAAEYWDGANWYFQIDNFCHCYMNNLEY